MVYTIQNYFDVMAVGAQAFKTSSEEMLEASDVLCSSNSEMQAAWLGFGSDKFELMKNTIEAYCKQMAEIAGIESENIASASYALEGADQDATSFISSIR